MARTQCGGECARNSSARRSVRLEQKEQGKWGPEEAIREVIGGQIIQGLRITVVILLFILRETGNWGNDMIWLVFAQMSWEAGAIIQVRDDEGLNGWWQWLEMKRKDNPGEVCWEVECRLWERRKNQRWLQDFWPEQLEGWSCHLLRWRKCKLGTEVGARAGHIKLERCIKYISGQLGIQLWSSGKSSGLDL